MKSIQNIKKRFNLASLFLFVAVIILSAFMLTACANDDGGEASQESSYQNRENSQKSSELYSESSKHSSSGTEGCNSNSGESTSKTSENSTSDSSAKPNYEPINPTATYISAKNSTEKYPSIVKTVYYTDDTVVVDAVATDSAFGADASGKTDSTAAIQAAINYVQASGGGTVFLPVGKYLVTDTISVPEYVTLRGDWQNPNAEAVNYGTIILAKPSVLSSSQNPQDKPLITLASNSGITGLTVYYPDKSVTNLKKYGYTVYANSPTTATVKCFTAINACYGIGVSLNENYNELIILEDVYGTFLYNVVAHNATSDVGSYDNINASPNYWLNATNGFGCESAAALRSFLSNNLDALRLGDLDDQLISNVNIDYAKRGISFVSGIRENSGFWGVIYNAQITNAEVGVYAETLNSRSGAVITASSVGKIENNSSVGIIKLSDVDVAAVIGSGRTVVEDGEVDLSRFAFNADVEFLKTENLYIAKNLSSVDEDSASAFNASLSLAVGGGILYVPNGVYSIKSTLTVPDNVELRSSIGVFSRTSQGQAEKNGVRILSYCNGVSASLGKNSGIRGIILWQADNTPTAALASLKSGESLNDNRVSVRAKGSGAYAYLCESVGYFTAYDFTACNNHIIKFCFGLAYETFIKAGGDNGKIIGCLANPNFVTRNNCFNYMPQAIKAVWQSFYNNESNANFILLRDEIGRTYTKMVKLYKSNYQLVFNTFCYGEAGLVEINGANNALLVNTSLDFLYNDKAVYVMNGGSATLIGSLRVYGYSIEYKGGEFAAYGRIAFGVLNEKAYDSKVNSADTLKYPSENAKRLTLFSCDSLPSGSNGITLNKNATFIKSGAASWAHASGVGGNIVEARCDAKNASSYKNGYLHMYIYVSDVSKCGEGQIEISSSGACDKNEKAWATLSAVTKSGWNEVWLDISAGGATGGDINLGAVNYLRIYALNSTCDFYIDQIEFVTD